MAEVAAVAAEELAALFETFGNRRGVLLAVSGGADSTALMVLAARWRDAGGATPLRVATVDHGLRPQSADECRAVAAQALALGLSCQILRWRGEKPSTRLQETARNARFGLLAAKAREAGGETIALAHTLDDQAETVLMRLARGSGPDGLAAMRRVTERGGVTILRPLLGIPKARLVATLQAAGLRWHEDPSNADPRFDRARARRILSSLSSLGMTATRLERLAERAARARDALDAIAAARLDGMTATNGRCPTLDAAAFADEPREIRLRLLARLLAAGAPTDAPTIRLERLEALESLLSAAFASGLRLTRTLGGKLVVLDRGLIRIEPERRRRRQS